MKIILLIMFICISNINAYLCFWPEQEKCNVGEFVRFEGDAPLSLSQYQNACRVLYKREVALEQTTKAAAWCPRNNTSNVTTALQVTYSEPYLGDTVFVNVNNYWSSVIAASSGSTEAITDMDRLESFRGGLDLVLYTFLAAAPIGLMVLLLRRSV